MARNAPASAPRAVPGLSPAERLGGAEDSPISRPGFSVVQLSRPVTGDVPLALCSAEAEVRDYFRVDCRIASRAPDTVNVPAS